MTQSVYAEEINAIQRMRRELRDATIGRSTALAHVIDSYARVVRQLRQIETLTDGARWRQEGVRVPSARADVSIVQTLLRWLPSWLESERDWLRDKIGAYPDLVVSHDTIMKKAHEALKRWDTHVHQLGTSLDELADAQVAAFSQAQIDALNAQLAEHDAARTFDKRILAIEASHKTLPMSVLSLRSELEVADQRNRAGLVLVLASDTLIGLLPSTLGPAARALGREQSLTACLDRMRVVHQRAEEALAVLKQEDPGRYVPHTSRHGDEASSIVCATDSSTTIVPTYGIEFNGLPPTDTTLRCEARLNEYETANRIFTVAFLGCTNSVLTWSSMCIESKVKDTTTGELPKLHLPELQGERDAKALESSHPSDTPFGGDLGRFERGIENIKADTGDERLEDVLAALKAYNDERRFSSDTLSMLRTTELDLRTTTGAMLVAAPPAALLPRPPQPVSFSDAQIKFIKDQTTLLAGVVFSVAAPVPYATTNLLAMILLQRTATGDPIKTPFDLIFGLLDSLGPLGKFVKTAEYWGAVGSLIREMDALPVVVRDALKDLVYSGALATKVVLELLNRGVDELKALPHIAPAAELLERMDKHAEAIGRTLELEVVKAEGGKVLLDWLNDLNHLTLMELSVDGQGRGWAAWSSGGRPINLDGSLAPAGATPVRHRVEDWDLQKLRPLWR